MHLTLLLQPSRVLVKPNLFIRVHGVSYLVPNCRVVAMMALYFEIREETINVPRYFKCMCWTDVRQLVVAAD